MLRKSKSICTTGQSIGTRSGALIFLIFLGCLFDTQIVLAADLAINAVLCQDLNEMETLPSRKTEVPLNPALGEVRYEIYGPADAPPVILIHGMGGSLESYDEIVHAMKHTHHVLVYDVRGQGGSLNRGENYSTFTMASDLKALVDYLHFGQSYRGANSGPSITVAGHSMGARVAARFAIQYPDLVSGLLVEDMDMIPRTSFKPEVERRAVLKAQEIRRRLGSQKFANLGAFKRALQPFFIPDDLDGIIERSELDADNNWVVRNFPPDANLLYWHQANSDDLLGDLEKLPRTTSISILQADTAQYWSAITDHGLQELKARLPRAQIKLIPEAGHGIHHDTPDEYLQALVGLTHPSSR